MRSYKIIGLLVILLLIIVSVVFLLTKNRDPQNIEIFNEESFFVDFEVKENKVYILCYLTIDNLTGKEQKLELYANMPDDVELGLLKEARIKGYNENGEKSEFILPTGRTEITVVFIGEFAGTKMKQNRLLPDIEIVYMD